MQETEAEEAEILDAVQNTTFEMHHYSEPWNQYNFFINTFTNTGATQVHWYLQREN